MKNNVSVALHGGLGNQLFQFATGLSVARKHHVPLTLDLTWFDMAPHLPNTTVRSYALAPFGVDVPTYRKPTPEGSRVRFFIYRAMRKLQRHLGISAQGLTALNEKSFRFDPRVLETAPPLHLFGYWQSPLYFDRIRPELTAMLGTPRQMNAGTSRLHEQIRNTDAICIHVRRGDYVTNQQAASTHGLCDMSYYHTGLAHVRQGLSAPHAFLFSDDAQWVRANLKLDIPMTVVDVNGPDDAHQDLWLMAACKRFVIANSSLSWWGAWLSEAQSKVVVAPSKWFADDKLDTTDLIPPDWLRV
ncbi:alpha-1,2-fucosyltransferase [Herbaspirillum sp. AP02]|uniref:alpha-1,2-fucosyltransferase n=1 Tax=unclassified Herbaspirillum TaxID=2624150 RepID=UPI0015DA0E84|nr:MULTISPECIES: alpha-1,2-fucosyltransferase [unclassified Herbaspirillum]MBG7620187.1 alpha-1,2-fucosyltransferase [Herbaspirillum sp. AP02]NZD67651.1 alpha-1,2-fucosyltransferase [Herbaspirillum sp. AP21]